MAATWPIQELPALTGDRPARESNFGRCAKGLKNVRDVFRLLTVDNCELHQLSAKKSPGKALCICTLE
jgi:hypothetical protein